MSVWKSKEHIKEKPWGHETRFQSPFGMGGKKIVINKGHRNSLKYYRMKNQLLYCLKGKVKVLAPKEKEFGQKNNEGKGNYFILEPGDYILIQYENPYRLEAITDCELFEVAAGPSHGIKQGLVMLEDDYGRLDIVKSKTNE
jgi:quercetin dioxygenase-like cupin family protein